MTRVPRHVRHDGFLCGGVLSVHLDANNGFSISHRGCSNSMVQLRRVVCLECLQVPE